MEKMKNKNPYLSKMREQLERVTVESIDDKVNMKLANTIRLGVRQVRLEAEKTFDAKRAEVQQKMLSYKTEDQLWLKAKQTMQILTKEDIKKIISGGLKMGKPKRIARKYLDFNKDGKVNFKDFVDMLKGKVDTDENGHIDVEELGKAIIDTVEIVQKVKRI